MSCATRPVLRHRPSPDPDDYDYGFLINTCFSFLSCSTKLMGTLSVWATMSAGERASHCVSGISCTRSDLYSSIQTRSSVSDVFSM